MYWNDVWMQLQQKNIQSGRGGGCWTTWQDEQSARRYDERVKTRFANIQRVSEVVGWVQPGWRVLDIGAGPGNLTIPLAEKAQHITAVEPAEGMVTVLDEHLHEHSILNVDIVQKRWDDVSTTSDLTPPYDLTIASYSLGMVDLLDTIRKINQVTRQQVVIYWHAGDQDWDYEAKRLWPIFHQTAYDPVPKSNVVFNLLYEMGVFPDVKSYEFDVTTSYSSLEEALDEYTARFDLHKGEYERELRSYIESEYQVVDGAYRRNFKQSGMRFCWKP